MTLQTVLPVVVVATLTFACAMCRTFKGILGHTACTIALHHFATLFGGAQVIRTGGVVYELAVVFLLSAQTVRIFCGAFFGFDTARFLVSRVTSSLAKSGPLGVQVLLNALSVPLTASVNTDEPAERRLDPFALTNGVVAIGQTLIRTLIKRKFRRALETTL